MTETLFLSEENVRSAFAEKPQAALELVESAFRKRLRNEVLLPDKISQVFDEKTQNRINCMPATLLTEGICGVKWVSVFPGNPKAGLRNVGGMVILSELTHGQTVAVMDAGFITGIRTAAVGAVAARYLAKEDAETIGFIGAGSEARRHLEMLLMVRPGLKRCRVSSRSEITVQRFIEEEQKKFPQLEFTACADDYGRAVTGADIIVTATSTQADLLKAEWISPGALYIHVGGWEDEYDVVRKADKIVCDEWECIKHRTQTLSRMYKQGLLTDGQIHADLADVISGRRSARQNNEEFIYFCSVGLAYIDIMFAKYAYDICREKNLGQKLEP